MRMNMIINGYEMEIEGEVLQRGFWLYVWRIINKG
jgi:hypothetical protein